MTVRNPGSGYRWRAAAALVTVERVAGTVESGAA